MTEALTDIATKRYCKKTPIFTLNSPCVWCLCLTSVGASSQWKWARPAAPRGCPDLQFTPSHWDSLWSNSVQHVKLQQSEAASRTFFINSGMKYSATLVASPVSLSAPPPVHYSFSLEVSNRIPIFSPFSHSVFLDRDFEICLNQNEYQHFSCL